MEKRKSYKMTPPKLDNYQTSYREQTGSYKCESCGIKCKGRLKVEDKYINDIYLENEKFSVFCARCNTEVCTDCWENNLCCKGKSKATKKIDVGNSSYLNWKLVCSVVVLITAVVYVFFLKSPLTGKNYKDWSENILIDEFINLKTKFPDQKQGFWRNILHVMNNSDTVTTLTLLYKDDSRTSECLAEEIAFAYSKIQNRTFDDESVFTADNQADDFGSVLEEYGLKVEKTNLLIVKNLHEISGNVARIFHTLCDSVTPKVAPSVYIFTLRYDESVENMENPIGKASSTLRKVWKDLPEKEIHALLARIITTVVEVRSIKTKHC